MVVTKIFVKNEEIKKHSRTSPDLQNQKIEKIQDNTISLIKRTASLNDEITKKDVHESKQKTKKNLKNIFSFHF